ncbi:hypothetical protein MIR68_005856 [Amoeboaphelidium protococcarum]|nr:hypothetical protein MIR68_005856 [Amoeboaphelidium protococcarum]
MEKSNNQENQPSRAVNIQSAAGERFNAPTPQNTPATSLGLMMMDGGGEKFLSRLPQLQPSSSSSLSDSAQSEQKHQEEKQSLDHNNSNNNSDKQMSSSSAAKKSVAAPSGEKQESSVASILAQNPQIMEALQGQLGQLVGQQSGYVQNLPAAVKRRVRALKGLQSQCNKLDREFRQRVMELEKEFMGKKQPLFQRRREIVDGAKDATQDEVEAGRDIFEDEESEDADTKSASSPSALKEEVDLKGIPEFWATVIRSCPMLEEIVMEEDYPALDHLIDVRFSLLADNPGFRLEFEFKENPFFENSILSKEYYLEDQAGEDDDDEVAGSDDLVYDHAVGTEIKWRDGKDLTHKIEIRKQRHKSTNKTRVVKKVVKTDSFFNFFNPPQMPEDDDEDDDQQEDEISEMLQKDYEVGEFFKEHLIPRAVDWFTGEAQEQLDFDDEEDDEEDDDEDYSEGEEDDQNEEDDDDLEGGDQTKPQECKQQ